MANVLDQNALEVPSAAPAVESETAPAVEPVCQLDPGPPIEPVLAMPPPAPPLPEVPQAADEGPFDPAEVIEQLYNEHRTLLFYVACRKFRITEGDAESLIQEVFLSFLQSGTRIDNPRSWLVAAICNASRHYWRAQNRTDQLPEDFARHEDPASSGLAEDLALQLTIQQCIRYLQPRCRETLALHYFQGRSATEVANELGTTVRYAEKLIHNCLKRVRDIYVNITAVTKK